MIARLGEAWVITRTNNRDVIDKWINDVPERENLRFVYVDLPGWARFWKRASGGIPGTDDP